MKNLNTNNDYHIKDLEIKRLAETNKELKKMIKNTKRITKNTEVKINELRNRMSSLI